MNRNRSCCLVRSRWPPMRSGTVLCLASAAAFGAMAVFGKLAYEGGATVGTLLAVRFALAATLFWALLLAGGAAGEVRALPGRDVALALALGACGYAAQAGGYFAALERIDASLLSLLIYTFPTMVAAGRSPSAASGSTQGGWSRSRSRRAGWCSSSPAPGPARSTRWEPRSRWAPRSSTAPT